MFVIHVSQARYFVDEVKDKTGKDIDVSTWDREFVDDLPEQENGFVF
jgi:sentrin-specific protease 1